MHRRKKKRKYDIRVYGGNGRYIAWLDRRDGDRTFNGQGDTPAQAVGRAIAYYNVQRVKGES